MLNDMVKCYTEQKPAYFTDFFQMGKNYRNLPDTTKPPLLSDWLEFEGIPRNEFRTSQVR